MNAPTAAHVPPGREVSFGARDGTPLVGTLFEPPGELRAALLVNSGTGIPRRFYARFARHAARRGFATLTYDFRGVGDSAPEGGPAQSAARYRDWGQRDMPGAIAWLAQRHPAQPLYVAGHSTGGQQLGLAPNVSEVDAAIFVCVSTGYWRGMPRAYGLLTLLLWNFYLPLVSRLYGYVPLAKMSLGEDLPTGVAREWSAWCLEPNYMAAFFDESGHRTPPDGALFGPTHFEKAGFPIRAYYFSDDRIATRANAGPMLRLYDRAQIETQWLKPGEIGARQVGHVGFFRSGVGAPLWDEALDWLTSGAG